MNITIIGTESLGVRGLSCMVKTKDRSFLIDPGIALGYVRNRLLPHPVQIAVGRIIRKQLIEAMSDATDLIISHFHGDHVPIMNANPYQLSIHQINYVPASIWAHPCDQASYHMKERETALVLGLDHSLKRAEGRADKTLSFLDPVPHGQALPDHDTVTMTVIDDDKKRFIHASDIQLLDDETVDKIIELKPDIVLASGPPLYRMENLHDLRRKAWDNAKRLSECVPTLILDHHLMRSKEGEKWLDKLSEMAGHRICCAADYMKIPRHLLEAMRAELYSSIPVPENWHKNYDPNTKDLSIFLDRARKQYPWFRY